MVKGLNHWEEKGVFFKIGTDLNSDKEYYNFVLSVKLL